MWENFKFNPPYQGEKITKISGVSLPQSYIDFMNQHNGGEGDIGETWLSLYPLENLQEMNEIFGIEEFLPDRIIIGTNGGEEFYGLNAEGKFFNVPSMFEEDCVTILCDNMEEFAEAVNEFWRNM